MRVPLTGHPFKLTPEDSHIVQSHWIVDEEIPTSSIPISSPAEQHSESKVKKPVTIGVSSTAETSGVCSAPLWAFGPSVPGIRLEHPSHRVSGNGRCLQGA